jgi:hypothetical protein
MKKLLVIILLFGITVAVSSQSIWRPIPKNLFKGPLTADRTIKATGIWLPRWTAGVSATQLNYNKVTKKLELGTFSKYGIGLSYAHYIDVEGLPYNNFSLNGFMFIPTQGVADAFSLGLTVSALDIFGMSLQAGVDFEPGKIKSDYFPVSPLLGIKYTF